MYFTARVQTSLVIGILCAIFLFTPSAFSQPRPGGGRGGEVDYEKDVKWEFGAHIGNILPNQVPGVTEIAPQWGLRGGYRLGPIAVAEVGGIAGKGEGVEWTNIHASIRFGVPIETLMGTFFLGGDVHSYEPEGKKRKTFGGGHVGGGIMSLIADRLWFRADMKFNINPGTSLYIGAGLMFRLGPDSGSGADR